MEAAKKQAKSKPCFNVSFFFKLYTFEWRSRQRQICADVSTQKSPAKPPHKKFFRYRVKLHIHCVRWHLSRCISPSFLNLILKTLSQQQDCR